jgi:hypothetical protein
MTELAMRFRHPSIWLITVAVLTMTLDSVSTEVYTTR